MKAPHQLELDALSNANQAAAMSAIGASHAHAESFDAPNSRVLSVEAAVLSVMSLGCLGYVLAWALGA